MNYRDQVFLSVAENLSFSKAAEDLFISQPAVTKHIKALEQSLDTNLFERKGNRIYLTKAGELTYIHLKEIEQKYSDLEFELGRLNDAFRGKLRIGASSTIAQYVIPKAIAAFHKRYPQIELHLLNGNSFKMEQLLQNNQIDLALVENFACHSGIKYRDFLEDEIVAVASKGSIYAKRKQIIPTDLKKIPLAVREKGSGTLEVIQKALMEHDIVLERLERIIHLGSTESIKNFLSDFEGIAFLPDKSIEKEISLNELVKIQIKGLQINRQFRIALRQGHETKSCQTFIHFILRHNF